MSKHRTTTRGGTLPGVIVLTVWAMAGIYVALAVALWVTR